MPSALDLIANKRVSRRGIFPFRFRGSCRLEPCLDEEVAPEIVQPAGGVVGLLLLLATGTEQQGEDEQSGNEVGESHHTPMGGVVLEAGLGLTPYKCSAVQSGWEACYDSRLKGSRKILSRIFQKPTPIPGNFKIFCGFLDCRGRFASTARSYDVLG